VVARSLGDGMPNRLNPLDEGHGPSDFDDVQWASQIASRRRDLVGALAETVLDRRLSPLEHTAVDIAIDRTVRGSDVPVLQWLSTDFSHQNEPTIPMGGSPRTGAWSGTHSGASSPATSPGSSTDPRRSHSIRHCR